jgi:uncharacterized membrane protein (UPF0127 family)
MSIRNKKQQRFSRYTASLLLSGILGIGLFGVVSCANEAENTTQMTTEVIAGTTFQHEGNLTFYYGDSSETNIKIEIAETEGAITQGLMYRKSMDFDKGMLFIFPDSDTRSFWMKNTIIPLDIIFVGEDMKIVAVKDHTTPYSTDSVPSDNKQAKYVIEVNAGFAGKFGINVGDSVSVGRL